MGRTMQSKERLLKRWFRNLALVAAKAVLAEGLLLRLAPLLLLLLRSTTAIAASTLRLLHGLLLHLRVIHGSTTKCLLLLRKGLSTGAGSCPRIRLFAPILQLPPVPLTCW
jgi:hypothetical protein